MQICDVRDGLEHTEGPIITPSLEPEQGRPFTQKTTSQVNANKERQPSSQTSGGKTIM